jgi:hypothetical protein
MNKENIARYFSDLKEVYDKDGLDKYQTSADSCDGLPHKLSISIFPEILSNKVDFGTEKLMEAFLTDIPFFTAATAADRAFHLRRDHHRICGGVESKEDTLICL